MGSTQARYTKTGNIAGSDGKILCVGRNSQKGQKNLTINNTVDVKTVLWRLFSQKERGNNSGDMKVTIFDDEIQK